MFKPFAIVLIILVILVSACEPAATSVPPTTTAVPAPPTSVLPMATVASQPPLAGRRNGGIAFSSDQDGNFEIWVMGADGSGQRPLTDNKATNWSPAWSPDGSQIAYTGDCAVQHGGDWFCSVFLMKADGSGKHRLIKDTWMFPWVEWAAGGKEVLWPGPGSVFATNLATGRAHSLLLHPSIDHLVELVGMSKNGYTIAVDISDDGLRCLAVSGQLLRRARTPTGWDYSNASVYVR